MPHSRRPRRRGRPGRGGRPWGALLWRVALLACVLSSPAAVRAQQPPPARVLVTGRVVHQGRGIAGAEVLLTAVGDTATARGVTDALGVFSIGARQAPVFVVVVRAAGFGEARRRVAPTDSLVVALEPISTRVLDPVRVVERRRIRVPRTDGVAPETGGSQRVAPVSAALAGEFGGNMAATLSATPGVELATAPDGSLGLSVLGIGPEQNTATLNGMRVPFLTLPRDAAVSGRVTTSTFDPARGGYSGAQVALQAASGNATRRRAFTATMDHPALQLHAPAASALGASESDVQLSGVATGQRSERWFYSVAGQMGVRRQSGLAVGGLGPGELSRLGLPASSYRDFLVAARAGGVDLGPSRVGHRAPSASVMMRLDRTQGALDRRSLLVAGRWAEAHDLGATALTAGNFGATSRAIGGTASIWWSRYVHGTTLNDLRLAISGFRQRPGASAAPELRVQIGDSAQDGVPPLTILAGATGVAPARVSLAQSELRNETAWQSLDGRHRFRVAAEVRGARSRQAADAAGRGAFEYASLPDFAAGRPLRFVREVRAAEAPGVAQLAAALSVSDAWEASRDLRLQLGARAEGSRLLASLVPDQAMLALNGGRVEPRFVGVSPRIGAQYSYGTTTRIPGMGAERRGSLRAGIGLFRGELTTDHLEPVMAASRGRDGYWLECLEEAVPQFDWRSRAEAPTQCARGGGTRAFQGMEGAAFAPGFRPPASWRSTLGWSGRIGRGWQSEIELTWSANVDQPSWTDLNLPALPAALLPGEAGRAVLAPLSAISAEHGIVPAWSARPVAGHGTLRELRSDMSGRSFQVVTQLAPVLPLGAATFTLSHVFLAGSQRQRGFVGSTGGDPRVAERARLASPRHQLQVTSTIELGGGWQANLFARVQGGRRYSPLVDQDINGDGLRNDRAFFPETLAAPAQWTRGAARCASREAGRVAARNACVGPMTTRLNAQLRYAPRPEHALGRLDFSLNLLNLPAGADWLLHHSRRRGWGGSGLVDPVALRVIGFDPGTARFRYAVNPSFGQPVALKLGVLEPFRVVLRARMSLGPSPMVQLLDRIRAPDPPSARGSAGRDKVNPDPDRILDELTARVPSAARAVVDARDSLRLAEQQVDSLWRFDKRFAEELRGTWLPLAQRLASLAGSATADGEARRLARIASARSNALLVRYAALVRDVLTPAQRRELPPLFAVLLDPRRAGSLLEGYP